MHYSKKELEKIASLAYLKMDSKTTEQLAFDVSSIMTFVEQLCSVDTDNISPLHHPLNIHQRLRDDKCTETNQVATLATIAPSFDADHYLVPTVIETGK